MCAGARGAPQRELRDNARLPADRGRLEEPILKKSDFDFELAARTDRAGAAARAFGQPHAVARCVRGSRCRTACSATCRDFLRPGDLLVFNDTRVLPARLYGRKESGGAVEILIERVTGAHEATVQLGVSKKPKEGGRIELADGSHAVVLGRDEGFFRLRFESPSRWKSCCSSWARCRCRRTSSASADASDMERYQTVFAREPGAVAAPTAGLHFDEATLAALRERGVEFGYVTLHVGAGTFQPVRADDLKDHQMHREWLNVGAHLVEQIRRTRAAGGRVIAVGTTVVRALESASKDGELHPFAGETQIFIFPGYRFTSIDGLLTNFHLPQSTLLMLVSALAGREFMLDGLSTRGGAALPLLLLR